MNKITLYFVTIIVSVLCIKCTPSSTSPQDQALFFECMNMKGAKFDKLYELASQQKFSECISLSTKYIEEKAEPEFYWFRTQCKCALGKPKIEVMKDVDKMVEIGANRWCVYCLRAQVKKHYGDITGMQQDCDKAVKLSPDKAQTIYSNIMD